MLTQHLIPARSKPCGTKRVDCTSISPPLLQNHQNHCVHAGGGTTTAVGPVPLTAAPKLVGHAVRDGELRCERRWTRGTNTVEQHGQCWQHGRLDGIGWDADGNQGASACCS